MTDTLDTTRPGAVTPGRVPDIGDRFTRDGHTYRFAVAGWLKRAVLEPLPPELAALFADLPPRVPPLVFCTREEAEYVTGRGVCGVVAPVAEVTVTGRVGGSPEHEAHARHTAALLVGEMIYGYTGP